MKAGSPLPQAMILEMATAFQKSRILLSAFDLEVFTIIGGAPKSAAHVAKAANADPRAMDRLLCALCALGLLTKSGDTFANTPLGLRFLDAASPDFLANLGHTSNQFRSFATLTEAVTAGHCVVPGAVDSDNPKRTKAFIAAMHRRADNAREFADLIGMDGVGRILDVGGGSGVYTMAMLKAAPRATAVILDLPKVAGLTRDYVAAAGMSSRIEIISGDYHSADFGSGFDLILFSAVIHINSPLQNQALMHKAYAALNPGGRIAVEDFIMDPDRCSPLRGALFAINMLVSTTSGDTYTEADISAWMRQSGCDRLTRAATGPASSLITGQKPA